MATEARWRDTDGLFKDHTANTQGVKYLGLRYDKLARTAHPASASLLDDCTDAAVVRPPTPPTPAPRVSAYLSRNGASGRRACPAPATKPAAALPHLPVLLRYR
jgi:hypothetical protein